MSKDCVSLSVQIVNSKQSAPNARKWAVQILDKMAPIKFSEDGANSIENDAPLFTAPLSSQTIYGPKNPFIRKNDKLVQLCKYIPEPKGPALTDKQVSEYLYKITTAYGECQLSQINALRLIDILQDTNKTPEAIAPEKVDLNKIVNRINWHVE